MVPLLRLMKEKTRGCCGQRVLDSKKKARAGGLLPPHFLIWKCRSSESRLLTILLTLRTATPLSPWHWRLTPRTSAIERLSSGQLRG